MASLLWLVLLLAVSYGLSARIVGFSSFGGSQYIMMRHVMEELGSRGHEVVLVVDSAQKIHTSENIRHKIYQVPYKTGFAEEVLIRLELEGNKIKMFYRLSEVVQVFCESFLNSTDLLEDLRNFDLIAHDSFAATAVLLAERFDIPRVEILPSPPNSPWAMYHRVPMPVAYVPQHMSGFSDQMSLFQRVMNLGTYFSSRLFQDLAFARLMNGLKVKYNVKPQRSFQDAVGDVELLIIAADFALEYPQPLLPGNIMVGPLNVKPPKPLPPDLETFVNSSEWQGFIVACFGTNLVSILPKEEVDMLALAFGKLKQHVVWKLKGYIPVNLRANIKVVDWLPQNDLLAHKKVKAFVSHAGHHSLYEAAYYGVPLVAYPLFSDQHANANKVEHFGLGLAVDHETVTAEQMYETIERVIREPRFKTEATRISLLLKDNVRTPLEKTGDWIERVIRHGGAKHLRPQSFNMPWYQQFLLDVIACLVATLAMVTMAIKMACKCARHLCCQEGVNKTKKD